MTALSTFDDGSLNENFRGNNFNVEGAPTISVPDYPLALKMRGQRIYGTNPGKLKARYSSKSSIVHRRSEKIIVRKVERDRKDSMDRKMFCKSTK
jgi:hypothetical protein